MIGEFIAALSTPIVVFIFLPYTIGLYAWYRYFAVLPLLGTHETIAYFIGLAFAQFWWLSILIRAHIKEK